MAADPPRAKSPQSVLFVCGMNSIRSPMASELTRALFPKIYAVSAGVRKMDLDSFAIIAMEEIGRDIRKHRPRTLDELEDLEGFNFDLIVTLSPENANALGNRCYLLEVDQTSYKVSSPADNLIMSNAEMQSSSGIGFGFILQALAALTATGNGTGLDNAAATTRGGAGHLHVIAASGTSPTCDVKIQHSTDGSTWVDLITFTQATDITYQRVEVTGTVNRHLRAIRTIGGTGPSFTLAVAFARF